MVITDPLSLSDREREILRYRPTQIHVDLDAIRENVRRIKKIVEPSLVAVVVKGNAYGHGMSAVSLALCDSEADVLCVATPESAFTLRKRGVNMPILLLSEPPIEAVQECYEYDITMCVYSKEIIDEVSRIANKKSIHVHLKVDTGMNRVGCEAEDTLDLVQYISTKPGIFLEGIFTHFATADEENHAKTQEQLDIFQQHLEKLDLQNLLPPIVHSANSSAALTLPDARYSMIRTGLAAYGVYPADHMKQKIELVPAITFSSKIMFLKDISVGESVSYGAQYIAEKDSRIATIPAGYSDGVPRNLGIKGGHVLIHGTRCPIIGAVTMDMMMVDVGSIDVSIGDEVILLGSQGNETVTPNEWADLMETIPYEIICQIGERLPRIYD